MKTKDDVINEIYDTLMCNTQHPQFDTAGVSCQELDAKNGRISFEVDGLRVYIEVTAENV